MSTSAPATVLLVAEDRILGDGPALGLAEAGFRVLRPAASGACTNGSPDVIVFAGTVSAARAFCAQQRNSAAGWTPVLFLGAEPCADGPDAPDSILPPEAAPAWVVAQVRLLVRLARAERANRTAVERLLAILDRAPFAVSVKDEQGRYLLVNRCWEDHFHHARDEVIGHTIQEVFAVGPSQRISELSQSALASGQPVEYEEITEQPDGPHIYHKTKFVLPSNGHPRAVCGITIDITERKRYEQALRDSQALYQSLVEALPVCLFRKDLDGRFTYVNGPFAARLGRTPEEVVGFCDQDFYPESLARKYTEDDRAVVRTGQVFEDIEENVTAQGERRIVQVIKSALRDSTGRVIGTQGVYWDVTEQKRAQEQLARRAADCAVARRMQEKLFPASASALLERLAALGLDVGGASYPVAEVGGDYYDWFPLDANCLGVAIGDVSGHGIGPALLMATTRSYLHAAADTFSDPGELLTRVNHLLAQDIESDRYVTLLLARIDLTRRVLSYASAGHAAGYVLAADGTPRQILGSTGPPLGIRPDEAFPTGQEIALAPGDTLVLVTDGIVEARDPARRTFDAERVIALVREHPGEPARALVERLYLRVRAFCQEQAQLDDITAVLVKVRAEPGG